MPRTRLRPAISALIVAAAAVIAPMLVSAQTKAPTQSEMIGQNDLNAFLQIARGYGIADIVKAENGDPVITGEINGTAYQLFFLECARNVDCEVMNFYAIWDGSQVALESLNEWNRSKPFHKAYLTEDGLPVVEFNLVATGGVAKANFTEAMDRWTVSLAEFESQILDSSL